MTILGIDHGDKYIGLSISEDGGNAYALSTISYSSFSKALDQIQKICQESQVDKIVIGLPLSSEGKETQQSQKAIAFGDKLGQLLNLDIEYQEERLTSFAAKQKLGRVPKKKYRQAENALAAEIILQDYLDNAKPENG